MNLARIKVRSHVTEKKRSEDGHIRTGTLHRQKETDTSLL